MKEPVNQTIEALHNKTATLLGQHDSDDTIIAELVKEVIEPSYAALMKQSY